MQTADRVQHADCRLQTWGKTQTDNCNKDGFFRQIRDNVSFCNLPSVTKSLFRCHLGQTFDPFLTYLFFFLKQSIKIMLRQ